MTIQMPNDIATLIKLIDTTFPLKHYPPGVSLVEIQRDLGKRDVVEFLKSLHRERVSRLHDGE